MHAACCDASVYPSSISIKKLRKTRLCHTLELRIMEYAEREMHDRALQQLG